MTTVEYLDYEVVDDHDWDIYDGEIVERGTDEYVRAASGREGRESIRGDTFRCG